MKNKIEALIMTVAAELVFGASGLSLATKNFSLIILCTFLFGVTDFAALLLSDSSKCLIGLFTSTLLAITYLPFFVIQDTLSKAQFIEIVMSFLVGFLMIPAHQFFKEKTKLRMGEK